MPTFPIPVRQRLLLLGLIALLVAPTMSTTIIAQQPATEPQKASPETTPDPILDEINAIRRQLGGGVGESLKGMFSEDGQASPQALFDEALQNLQEPTQEPTRKQMRRAQPRRQHPQPMIFDPKMKARSQESNDKQLRALATQQNRLESEIQVCLKKLDESTRRFQELNQRRNALQQEIQAQQTKAKELAQQRANVKSLIEQTHNAQNASGTVATKQAIAELQNQVNQLSESEQSARVSQRQTEQQIAQLTQEIQALNHQRREEQRQLSQLKRELKRNKTRSNFLHQIAKSATDRAGIHQVETEAQPPTGRPPATLRPTSNGSVPVLPPVRHSQPTQPNHGKIQAYRAAARQLDQVAADLEDVAAYDWADRLREQAAKLRQKAREWNGPRRGPSQ